MVCRVGMRRLLALGGRKFSIDAFMAGQSDGFYFDFTRTDRHFQEHTGPTLADDIGESIGLALDQRTWGSGTLAQVLAAQPELVANGDFSSALSGWTAVGVNIPTLAAVGGRWRATASGSAGGWFGGYTVLTDLTIGKTYRVAVQATLQSGWTSFSNFVLTVMDGAGATSIVGAIRSTAGLLEMYFVATATSHAVRLRAEGAYVNGVSYAEFDDLSVKLVPGYSALQSTGTMKPTRQTSGAKFDGSDDNLLTTYYATSGANFIAASVSVPATLSAVQVIAGASGSGANRTFLAIDTSGRVCAGVGSDSTTVHVGTTDLRGTDTVIALSYDGTTVRLFAWSTLEYSGPQASTPTTTIPYRIGSLNSNGTAASFSAAAIKRIVVGREFLTTPQFAQLAPALRG